MNQKILITGAAGFIGFHQSCMLLEKGYQVIGVDNLNHYYSPLCPFTSFSSFKIEQNLRNMNKCSEGFFEKIIE